MSRKARFGLALFLVLIAGNTLKIGSVVDYTTFIVLSSVALLCLVYDKS